MTHVTHSHHKPPMISLHVRTQIYKISFYLQCIMPNFYIKVIKDMYLSSEVPAPLRYASVTSTKMPSELNLAAEVNLI